MPPQKPKPTRSARRSMMPSCRLVISLLAARRKQGTNAHKCAATQQGTAIKDG